MRSAHAHLLTFIIVVVADFVLLLLIALILHVATMLLLLLLIPNSDCCDFCHYMPCCCWCICHVTLSNGRIVIFDAVAIAFVFASRQNMLIVT